MKIGDIVVCKGDNRLVGEVIAIDDYDRATVILTESGIDVMIDIYYLAVVKEAEYDL